MAKRETLIDGEKLELPTPDDRTFRAAWTRQDDIIDVDLVRAKQVAIQLIENHVAEKSTVDLIRFVGKGRGVAQLNAWLDDNRVKSAVNVRALSAAIDAIKSEVDTEVA